MLYNTRTNCPLNSGETKKQIDKEQDRQTDTQIARKQLRDDTKKTTFMIERRQYTTECLTKKILENVKQIVFGSLWVSVSEI